MNAHTTRARTTRSFSIPVAATRFAACAATAALALALAGCAGTKDQYAASADVQQRLAAEAAADTKTAAAVDSQATYLKVVDQMQQEGLWFASLAHIDALEQRWGVSPESTRMRGDALRQTGQAVASESAYKRLMGTRLDGAGYRGLGLLAGARGDYAQAIEMLTQAQRRTPTDASILSDLGYASLRAGRITEARMPLMQALQLKPDNAQAQANLALYLELDGQTEQANALMEVNRIPVATRAGIRDAARQLRAGQPLASTPPLPTLTAAPSTDVMNTPLALKASRSTGSSGLRTAKPLNPSIADSTSSQSSSTTSQGTQ